MESTVRIEEASGTKTVKELLVFKGVSQFFYSHANVDPSNARTRQTGLEAVPCLRKNGVFLKCCSESATRSLTSIRDGAEGSSV